MNRDHASLLPCMGGWCQQREHCANFHAGSPAMTPQERICERGQDGYAPWAVVIPMQTADQAGRT